MKKKFSYHELIAPEIQQSAATEPQGAQTAYVSSLAGVYWDFAPQGAGECYSDWLKRLDADFFQRLNSKLEEVGMAQFTQPGYRLPRRIQDHLNGHPVRKSLFEMVMLEAMTKPIQITMSKEEFERTYIGTWLPEKKQHDCPMDAVAVAFCEAALNPVKTLKVTDWIK